MNSKTPKEMTTEEKLTELVEIGRENLKLQHLNNMLLIVQSQEFSTALRKEAKLEALSALGFSQQISEDTRLVSVIEYRRLIEQKEAYEKRYEEYQKEKGIGH